MADNSNMSTGAGADYGVGAAGGMAGADDLNQQPPAEKTTLESMKDKVFSGVEVVKDKATELVDKVREATGSKSG